MIANGLRGLKIRLVIDFHIDDDIPEARFVDRELRELSPVQSIDEDITL